MRNSLAYSATERRRRHIAPPWRRSRDVEIAPQSAGADADPPASNGAASNGAVAHIEQTSSSETRVPDSTMSRARAAGGPVDVASYSCSCGMIFSASVSTSVACPHCGTEQDW